MRVTSKGQVTLPLALRERAGLMPNTEVEFFLEDGIVRIVPADAPKAESRGDRIVARLRGRGAYTMSTDAIMAMTRGED